jgi:hypothetical protein
MLVKLKFHSPEIVLGMLLAVAIFAIGMVFSSHHPVDNNAPTNNNNKTETNRIVKPADERIADYTLALDLLTFVLAAATIGLGIITGAGIRNQSNETRILQRAYIVAEPYGIDTFTDGKQIIGYTGIRNAGRVPATELRWFSRLTPSNSGKWNETIPQTFEGCNILAPGTLMREGSKTALHEKIRDLTGGGGKFLYVWGEIEYLDGFGKRRRTQFCHRYNWARNREEPGRLPTRFRISRKYGRHHIHGNSAT